jgi:hypothetical protein
MRDALDFPDSHQSDEIAGYRPATALAVFDHHDLSDSAIRARPDNDVMMRGIFRRVRALLPL